MILKDRRIGKFYISIKTINDNPELVLEILSKVIVVRAELIVYNDSVKYHGISENFHPIKGGDICPTYDITVTRIEGRYNIEFKRVRKFNKEN